MNADQQVIDPLPPEVMEAINSYGRYYAEHHKLGMSVRDDMKYIASVAIRCAQSPERAPEGWKLVPVGPTNEMHNAAIIAYYDSSGSDLRDVYRAMLAASPQPQVEEKSA